MGQRLLRENEVDDYRSQIAVYHPSGEIVMAFARSNFAVIAGPTGAGKDTIRNELVKDSNFVKVLSTTSRPQREGEVEGEAYHFRDLKFFDEGMNERRFLQVALVHSQQISCIDFNDIANLEPNQIGISILVVQTEREIRRLKPDLKTVFLIPPNLETLMSRIGQERKMSKEEVARRLEGAKEELNIALNQSTYFCVVNDQLDIAKDKVAKYFKDSAFDKLEDQRARTIIKTILEELKSNA